VTHYLKIAVLPSAYYHYCARQVSTEVSSELSELVAAPSQTVCFLARTYNNAIEDHYQPDAQPRPVSSCLRPTPPPLPRPLTAVARPVTAAVAKDSSDEGPREVRQSSDNSPFVETLVNLTLHSQLQNVELLNVDEMLELAATVLQTHCHDRCDNNNEANSIIIRTTVLPCLITSATEPEFKNPGFLKAQPGGFFVILLFLGYCFY